MDTAVLNPGVAEHPASSPTTAISPSANRPPVVAQRRHLPDLHPQLRGWERGRHGRPRRGSFEARLPARPRCRRAVVHPLVRVPARRRRVRRRGLPHHPPLLRRPGRGRGAHPRGARPWHPHDHRHRPPTTSPTSTRGSSGRSRRLPARPSANGSGSAPAAARTATRCPTTGSPTFRATPGPARPTPTDPRRVVPAPVHPGAARPQLEPPRRAKDARGRAAVLVRPRRRRGAHRLGRAAHQGPRASPKSPRR